LKRAHTRGYLRAQIEARYFVERLDAACLRGSLIYIARRARAEQPRISRSPFSTVSRFTVFIALLREDGGSIGSEIGKSNRIRN